MAIYHCSVKVVQRSKGRSVTAAAAYRSGSRIVDHRTGQVNDYTRKRGIDFTAIYSPSPAPAWVQERSALWNSVETAEKRKDAQLARDVEIALPCELTYEQNVGLVEGFIRSQFVALGMVADVAIHNADGKNPHAHILLTMRELTPDGFGNKNREWNDKVKIEEWREAWEIHANQALERIGSSARISRHTLEAQGIDRLPTIKLGPVAAEIERKGNASDRGDINRARLQINNGHKQAGAQIIQLQEKRDDLECMVEPDKVIDRYKKVWAVEREIITVKSGELKAKTDRQIDRQELKINSLAKAEPRKGLFTTKTTHAKNLKQWRNTAQQLNNRRWQLKERADKLKKGGIETREGKYEGYDYQTDGDKLAHKRVERKEPRLAGMYQKAKQAQWEKDREKLQQKRQNTRQQPQQNQNPRGDGR